MACCMTIEAVAFSFQVRLLSNGQMSKYARPKYTTINGRLFDGVYKKRHR
jgi:hypothetical protein